MMNWDCFRTSVLKPRVVQHEAVSSTNTHAKRLLEAGEPEGLVVLARTQTSGRGRRRRTWFSPPGGLYFTLLLNPRFQGEQIPLLGLLAACAVATALRDLGVKEAKVKWPNDILVRGSKISGILTESVFHGRNLVGVALGIGVNQNVPVSLIETEVDWPVASVIDELGHETSTESLLCSIVNEIDRLLAEVEAQLSCNPILDCWRRMSCTIGRQVRILEDGAVVEGLAKDIGSDGSLRVETGAGVIHVLSGVVRHLDSAED